MGTKMKKFLPVLMSACFLNNAFAFTMNDVQKIKNDKEVLITSFSKREKERILDKYNDQAANEKLRKIFYSTMLNFINDEEAKQCESDFFSRLKTELKNADIATDKESLDDHLKMLRATHAIDDVLFDIVTSINEDAAKFSKVDLKKPVRASLAKNEDRLEKNSVDDLYWAFAKWPDDKTRCSTQEFVRLKESVAIPAQAKEKVKAKYLGTLNKAAYEKKIITLETYNKLEYYRTDSNLEKRYIWLNDYIKIVLSAKNAMVPRTKGYDVKKLDAENRFSSEKLKRFSALTRRKILYKKYNETQIILLSQVLQKASRRMGVDADTITKAPYLIQEFELLKENGERQTYVERTEIDPQSQYNLARRLMRKDIVDLQMMSLFNRLDISYEDVVMAALETGYISLEDIEFVVAYDDLWNPTTSKYERMSGFIFKVAGYTTFFLPPPFNVAASIALGIVEGIVDQRFENGASHDNPGTFIE